MFHAAVGEVTEDGSVATIGPSDPLALHEGVRDAVLRRGLDDDAVQRALAQWSLYENYFTYPDSREYFLKKMRAAAAPGGSYRASRKDVTGALMQLFLFPFMMRQDRLGPGHRISGTRIDDSIPVVIVQGEADDICDASVARRLFDELMVGAKRNHKRKVRYMSCEASHDVLDDGPMQAAFVSGTEVLFDFIMQ
jgi:pimeloyl-ACP methyl ester carboxylesterase